MVDGVATRKGLGYLQFARGMPGDVCDLVDELCEELNPAPVVWTHADGRMFVVVPDADGWAYGWSGPFLTSVEVIAELNAIADELRRDYQREGEAALAAAAAAKGTDDDDDATAVLDRLETLHASPEPQS